MGISTQRSAGVTKAATEPRAVEHRCPLAVRARKGTLVHTVRCCGQEVGAGGWSVKAFGLVE